MEYVVNTCLDFYSGYWIINVWTGRAKYKYLVDLLW